MFDSVLLSQELVQRSVHIYRDRSHESWPEARRASGIVSRAKLISRMKTDENRIEDSMALNIVEIVVRLRITPASGALWAHPLVSQKKKKKER